jgi:argininosuccinate synthase
MEVLQAFINDTQKNVTGVARVKLYKGNCIVVGRKSPYSLYSEDFATFEKDEVYNQMDATGFIRLNALRLRIQALKKYELDQQAKAKVTAKATGTRKKK